MSYPPPPHNPASQPFGGSSAYGGQPSSQPPQYTQPGGQPPQYTQPGGQPPQYTQPGSSRPRKSKLVTAGKVLTFVGGGLLVLSLIVGTILGVLGGGRAADVHDAAFRVNGSTTKQLEAGTEWQVYAPEGRGHRGCKIVGTTRPGPAPTQSSSMSFDGRQYTSTGGFSVTETGSFTITCADPDIIIAPPVSVGGLLGIVGGVLIAVLGGLLGAVLTVLGIILWVVGRKQAQRV